MIYNRFYNNPAPIAYPPDDKGMPVPGWDMRTTLAGPRIIGVGAFHGYSGLGLDMTIQTPLGPQKISIPIETAMDQAIGDAVQKAWPQIQPKLHAELESAAADMQKTMRRDMTIAAVGLIAAMVIIEMIEWKKLKI